MSSSTSNYGKRKAQRDVPGSRRLGTTYGRTTHLVSSHKHAGRAPFHVESQAEQLIAQVLDLDPDVLAFTPQGFTVDLVAGTLLHTEDERKAARSRYKDRPGPSLYTPDFVRRLVGNTDEAIEVKLDSYTGDERYVEKLALATPIMVRHGRSFRVIVVPADQRHPVWTNVPLICQALMRQDLWPTPPIIERLVDLAGQGAQTSTEFMTPLGLNSSYLPHFMVAGALSADILAHAIRGSMPVTLAQGDLGHLQLLERLTA